MVDAVETRPGTDPDRASFTTAIETARDQLTAAAGIFPDDPAGLPGAIGRAVLDTLLPARRPRYSARNVKCTTSRYHARDDGRPALPATITAIDITICTPPVDLKPGRTHRDRRTPRPPQPPTRRQRITTIMNTDPGRHGAAANSPRSSRSNPATCSPSSPNGHAWGSSPGPGKAPTRSTRQRAIHP